MISDDLKLVILSILKLETWEICDETTAAQIPGWDSLMHVNVIIAIEKHFDVRFRSIEVLKLKTIGDLQRLVDSKLKK
jgi:acyl carrier protein